MRARARGEKRDQACTRKRAQGIAAMAQLCLLEAHACPIPASDGASNNRRYPGARKEPRVELAPQLALEPFLTFRKPS